MATSKTHPFFGLSGAVDWLDKPDLANAGGSLAISRRKERRLPASPAGLSLQLVAKARIGER